MWEDLLKSQVSVPRQKLRTDVRQKLRTDSEPLPDDDDTNCYEELMEYLEKFKNWKPVLEVSLINPTMKEAQYYGDNLVPILNDTRFSYENIMYGNPVIEEYYKQYLHGARTYWRTRPGNKYSEEEACAILEMLYIFIRQLGSKNNLDKQYTIEDYNFKIHMGIRYSENRQRTGYVPNKKILHFNVRDGNGIIFGLKCLVTDFHLPYKDEYKPMKYTSNYDEIKLDGWI
jgi:hypothetical protein